MADAENELLAGGAPAVPQLDSKRSRRKSYQKEIFPQDVSSYTISGRIGQGAFASVYKAYCTTKDLDVAIKVIELETSDRDIFEKVSAETQTMLTLHHENILLLYACFVYKNEAWAILPLMVTTCSTVLKNFDSGLEEKYVARIVKDVVCGLEYLHKQSLVHADLKSGNILLNRHGISQIADFGVTSSLITFSEFQKLHQISGTVHWMAPEVAKSLTKNSEGYDSKADIWSLGITCLELAAGKPPHYGLERAKAMMAILTQDPPTVDTHVKHRASTSAFKQFVSMCLQVDPSSRKTAKELKTTAFIDSPLGYPDLADFLQLGEADNPYNTNLDDKALPKSLLQETQDADHGWNFTVDSDTQEEIADIAQMVVDQENAAKANAEASADTTDASTKRAEENDAGSSKETSTKASSTKPKKDKCIIS